MRLSRRHFLKSTLVATVAGMGGLGHFVLGQSNELDVSQISLTLPRLPAAFDGYKIVQLSDIHMGTGMTEARLQEIVDLVNAQRPDMVALTGDYVSLGRVENVADALIRPLAQLAPRDHVIGVMGNHDRHANAAQTQEVLAQSNVIELSNEVFTLERDGQLLTIAGVDDAWYHHDRLDLVLEKLPDEGGAVLLMHEPDFADSSAPTGRFDLQLSGHSHGGQIVLGSGPVVLPDLGKKYHTGQYQLDDMILYTNRGVGVTIPPVRINCPAEISVFTLHPAI
jgi:predicted MPP superfamily phosphohydrolase